MASLSLALDEIISNQRQKRGGGGSGTKRVGRMSSNRPAGFGRRVGGGGSGRYMFSDDVPSGKWKHDKFSEIYNGGRKFGGGGGGGGRFNRRRSTNDEIVKLNISNLPESVVTADLEELFQDFGIHGVVVHYDETGAHVGTADLFVDSRSANAIIREFSNIAIDGQEMKIAIVDESGGKVTIRDRIQRIARNPIRNRKPNLRRSVSARSGNRGRNVNDKKKPIKLLNSDDLDKELEAYMSIRNSEKN